VTAPIQIIISGTAKQRASIVDFKRALANIATFTGITTPSPPTPRQTPLLRSRSPLIRLSTTEGKMMKNYRVVIISIIYIAIWVAVSISASNRSSPKLTTALPN